MTKFCLPFALLTWISLPGNCQDVHLEKISSKGKELQLITIGSSLSSGVRDNGLILDGQKFAYPSLISKQMGLTKYKQALLKNEEKNGLGYQKLTSYDNYLNYTTYNSSGVEQSGEGLTSMVLSKAENDIDDFSLPYLKILDLIYDFETGGNPLCERKFIPYFNRIKNDSDRSSVLELLKKKILSKRPDFFIFELGYQDVLSYVLSGAHGRNLTYLTGSEYYPQEDLLSTLTRNNSKGIIATIPDILKFPIFKFYTLENALKINNVENIYVLDKNRYLRPARNNDIFLPNPSIDSLMNPGLDSKDKKGMIAQLPLSDSDIFSEEEQLAFEYFSPSIYNEKLLAPWAKKYDLAIVDLNDIFNRIIDGAYYNEDGIKVDASFPRGNFFSADGFHPTSFGQAIIANEYIKAINRKYASNIPLLKTSSFL